MISVLRHFLLGVILGVLTIIMLYVMWSSVIVNDKINCTNELIVILSYGIATMIIGEILVKISPKKKK